MLDVTEHISPPSWFAQAFKHLSAEDLHIVARLWQEEPALRELIQRLDMYHPSRWRPLVCPVCDNSHIRRTEDARNGAKHYFCGACDTSFAATLGTPFYRLLERSYPRLYGAAVTLWGPWTPFFAWRIAGCSDTKQMADYCRRLQPLFGLLDVMPLVSRPAYRLGFTPGQQGVRCLRCDGTDLGYANRNDADNPCFKCKSCNYSFFLHASRRHFLPIPPEVHCPGCEGRNLNKKMQRPDGRLLYRCRDCSRTFITSNKKYQPAKYGQQTTRPVPAGVTCPSCDNANIRITTIRQDGRTIFQCNDCSRQFLNNPKRLPTRLKYGAVARR